MEKLKNATVKLTYEILVFKKQKLIWIQQLM